jgi:hypothetical protein
MADVCSECGERVDPAATFCPLCLASITPAAPQAAAPAPLYAAAPAAPPTPAAPQAVATPSAPAKSNLPLIVGIIAAGLLMVAALSFFLMNNKAPVEDEPPPVAVAGGSTSAVGPEVAKYLISDANIRNLPTAKGSETKIVGTVQRGVQVKGAMHSAPGGDSYWFKLSDGRGYISAVNLSDAAPAAGAVAAVPAGGSPGIVPVVIGTTPPVGVSVRAPIKGAPFCQVATKGGNLRIRSSPNGAIVGGMPKGARFQAFGNESDPAGAEWYQVQPVETRYPNGWVSADFIAC